MIKETREALLKRLEVLQKRELKLDFLMYEQSSFKRYKKAAILHVETERKMKMIERLINK